MSLCLQSPCFYCNAGLSSAVLKRLWSQADLAWNPASFTSKLSNLGKLLHHSEPQFSYIGIVIEVPAQGGYDH